MVDNFIFFGIRIDKERLCAKEIYPKEEGNDHFRKDNAE